MQICYRLQLLTRGVRIAEKLRISVVLAGYPYLNEILDPKATNKNKYINIHNTFLKWHPYSILKKEDLPTVITEWEKNLGWSKPLNLYSDSATLALLEETSQGQLGALYRSLGEIAAWTIDRPKAQLNPQNISKALGLAYQPISKLQEK